MKRYFDYVRTPPGPLFKVTRRLSERLTDYGVQVFSDQDRDHYGVILTTPDGVKLEWEFPADTLPYIEEILSMLRRNVGRF